MEKIKVIIWEGGCDNGSVYRLDNPTDGARLFKDLLKNAETDGSELFCVEEMTQEEWDECVRNGEEEA